MNKRVVKKQWIKGKPSKKKLKVREGCFHEATSPSEESYLIGSKCLECGYVSFPKRAVCPACIKENTMEETRLSQRGEIYSYTVLHVSIPGFPAPYVLGRIKLPEGLIVTSLITGCEPVEEALEIGQKAELVIEKIREDDNGNEIIGYKFRPWNVEKGRKTQS
jgi:uncharacterized OB-fold protein